MTVLSSIVATVGLVRDSVAVVIGAMVIAPLLGPHIALAFAASLGDLKLAGRLFWNARGARRRDPPRPEDLTAGPTPGPAALVGRGRDPRAPASRITGPGPGRPAVTCLTLTSGGP